MSIPPAKLLMGRNIRTKLPEHTDNQVNKDLRDRDEMKKRKMKEYADEKNHASESDLKEGDRVIVKERQRDKAMSPFDPKPYTITQRKGTMITASRDGKSIPRNASFFKRVRIKDSLIQSKNTNDDSDNSVSGDRVHQEQREGEDDEANDQGRRCPRRITARPNYYHETSV